MNNAPPTHPTLGPKVGLTRRELEIAQLLCQGLANKQIARQLGIEESTVKNTIWKTMQKTGTHNRVQLALTLIFQLRILDIHYHITYQPNGPHLDSPPPTTTVHIQERRTAGS